MDADKLKAAISKLTGSTAAAKLRQVMPEIVEKVEQGVRHDEIVAALQKGGIEVNLETFRKNLYRYRAKQRAAVVRPPAQSVPASRADGNPPVVRHARDEAVEPATAAASSFEDALDPRKRDQLGEQYLNRRKPILKRSDK